MSDTTRRYPRSTAEAFADERAQCVEHYVRDTRLAWVALLAVSIIWGVGLGMLVVLLWA